MTTLAVLTCKNSKINNHSLHHNRILSSSPQPLPVALYFERSLSSIAYCGGSDSRCVSVELNSQPRVSTHHSINICCNSATATPPPPPPPPLGVGRIEARTRLGIFKFVMHRPGAGCAPTNIEPAMCALVCECARWHSLEHNDR